MKTCSFRLGGAAPHRYSCGLWGRWRSYSIHWVCWKYFTFCVYFWLLPPYPYLPDPRLRKAFYFICLSNWFAEERKYKSSRQPLSESTNVCWRYCGSGLLSVNQNMISIPTSVTKPVLNFRVCANVLPDVGSVEGLAYHRAWDTLYWTSSTTSTISRHTLDQSRVGAFAKEAVVTLSEDDHPHMVALDECQKSVVLSTP